MSNLSRQVHSVNGSDAVVLQAGEAEVLSAAGVSLAQVNEFCEGKHSMTLQAAIDGTKASLKS